MSWRTNTKGQASVEAAFAIPVVFILLLLLLQPGIILYDRMIMRHAAAQACRMLATSPAGTSSNGLRGVDVVKRQLSAIPPHELFHVHYPSCSWDIQLTGNETAEMVSVSITNRIKLLPLFDAAAAFAGIADGEGCIELYVSESAPTQPSWVAQGNAGISPQTWVSEREGE